MRRFSSSWTNVLGQLRFRRKKKRRTTGGRGRRSRFEPLETRAMLAITVNSLLDNTTAGDNLTTLREAIDEANLTTEADEIVFDASLTGAGPATIDLSLGQLQIDQPLTISGPGAELLSIDANEASRIYDIDTGVVTTISGLTLSGGHVTGSDDGGAIRNLGDLTLDSVVLVGNYSADYGGAIRSTGPLEIINSTLEGNTAGFTGGAISISTNAVEGLVIKGSAFIGNHAANYGALHLDGNDGQGTASIVNSTFSGNWAAWHAGAIQVAGGAPALTVVNSTITDNHAGPGYQGGGIRVTNGSSVRLDNTILAGNTAGVASKNDLAGTLESASSYNLFGMNVPLPAGAGNFRSDQPGLAPLGEYGGPTKTHALLADSLAIDAGSDDATTIASLTTDQRGYNRFVYRDDTLTNVVDIGAYELGLVVSTPNDQSNTDYSHGDLSLREALVLAAQIPNKNEIEFDTDLVEEIVLDSELGSLVIDSDLTIEGPGGDLLTINANAQGEGPYIGPISVENATVTIAGLKLTGGNSGPSSGGAIDSINSDLTLERLNITGNVNDEGGATVWVFGGSLKILNSTIDDNDGLWGVGGVYVSDAPLTIIGSTISNNSGEIAGIEFWGGTHPLEIFNSTVSGNEGQFTQNDIAGVLVSTTGSAKIINSTIYNNKAYWQATGVVAHFDTVVTLHNSIVAGNNAQEDAEWDLSRFGNGAFDPASSHNLIGYDPNSLFPAANDNQIGTTVPIDPLLTPLGDYGGPTLSHALVFGSPAIDTGDNGHAEAAGLFTDQRGRSRYLDENFTFDSTSYEFDGIFTVNIGATELVLNSISRREDEALLYAGDEADNSVTINDAFLTFFGGASKVIADGFSGNDEIIIDATVTVPALVYGATGVDTLQGGSADDVLDGGADMDVLIGGDGDDLLIGGDGMDTLEGGAGDDELRGGTGDDRYQFTGNTDLGHDTLFELIGEGFDTLDFDGFDDGGGTGVTLDLNQSQLVDEALLELSFAVDGDESIEGLVGSAFADILRGNELDNHLDGGIGGPDELFGRGGDDHLMAVPGSKFYGGDGYDFPEFVDDDLIHESQFAVVQGTWSSDNTGGFNGSQRTAAAFTGSNPALARWSFGNLPQLTEPVELYGTWSPDATFATDAQFDVRDSAGVLLAQQPAPVDMTQNATGVTIGGTVWQSLGIYTDVGDGLRVELSNTANGSVVADGVLFLSPPTPPMTPTGFQFVGSGINRRIVWNHPGDTMLDVDGYEIERSKTGLGDWELWADINDATEMSTNTSTHPVPLDETEFYRIRSTTSGLRGNSEWSELRFLHGYVDGLISRAEEAVVKLRASGSMFPTPTITLDWLVQKNHVELGYVYNVYRKSIGAAVWDLKEGAIAAANHVEGRLTWTDHDVVDGSIFEYRVERRPFTLEFATFPPPEGMIVAALDRPLVESRGTLVLVLDEQMVEPLAYEIARLKQDFIGDGWEVKEVVAERDPTGTGGEDSGAAVQAVKQSIQDIYDAAPQNVKAVFLLGNVPVPYSGDSFYQNVEVSPGIIITTGGGPDGHSFKSFPADAYYGDVDHPLDGWTDSVDFDFIDSLRSRYNSSWDDGPDGDLPDGSVTNVAGDGRFDQDLVPSDSDGSPVELAVGRVDLSRIAKTFANDFGSTALSGIDLDVALLRRYLDKDHAYRHGIFDVPERALVVNTGGNPDTRVTEWKNYAPILGHENVAVDNWIMHMDDPAFAALFASASSNTSDHRSINIANGIFGDHPNDIRLGRDRTTPAWSVDDKENFTVFHAFSASYFLDWNKDNNFMLAFLANDGYGLTAQWNHQANTDDILFQHMGIGETTGFANLVSEVGFTGTEVTAIWRGLLGDPTLRMHVVKPPSNAQTSVNGDDVVVTWSASPIDFLNEGSEPSEDFQGYRVYRATSFDSDFQYVGHTWDLWRVDNDPAASASDVYIVRAVKREVVPSGTYFNASQGAFSQNPWETTLAVNFGGNATSVFESDEPPGSHPIISSSIPVVSTELPITSSGGSVTSGTPLKIFKTARYGSTVGSSIALNVSVHANTDYMVRLYFAEIAAVALGERLFDISVEGETLADYDIMEDVGGHTHKGVVKTFVVTVGSDGILDVDLNGSIESGVVYGPLISAIEVLGV